VEYSEYREVGGVNIPSKWTMMWLGGRSRYVLTLVQPNVAIDAGRLQGLHHRRRVSRVIA
jgi:hypothetical protein